MISINILLLTQSNPKMYDSPFHKSWKYAWFVGEKAMIKGYWYYVNALVLRLRGIWSCFFRVSLVIRTLQKKILLYKNIILRLRDYQNLSYASRGRWMGEHLLNTYRDFSACLGILVMQLVPTDICRAGICSHNL